MSEDKEAQEQQDQQEHADSRSGSKPSEESLERPSTAEAHGRSEPADKSPSSRRGGNATAWLALVLALCAVGLAGWQWWLSETRDGSARFLSRIDQQASAIESQSQQLEQLGERVGARMDALESRLDTLAGQLDSSDFDPSELRRQVRSQADAGAELRQRVDSLSERLDESFSNLESRVEQAGSVRSGQIEESLEEASFRLGLIEVAGLLRLGQSRAELATDPAGAVAAYQRAQSRLDTIQDERATRLRQLVAQELEALRSVETTDWATLTGQLSALEVESAQWPMSSSDERIAAQDRSETSGEAAKAGDGWWSSLRSSLDGLVRVTPRESAPLTPAAVESVRERVRLHLAAAQAAAARRSADELTRHLETAGELIRTHFDTSVQAVARALETISEAGSVKTPSLPDLGGALAEAERRLAAS